MRIILVPPVDIKPLTEEEAIKVQGWMARDKGYEGGPLKHEETNDRRSCGCLELRTAICSGRPLTGRS
jgi:hypothetical protein